jgi:pentatricopeptide repeat protein
MYNDDETRKSDEVYMRQLYERFRSEVESGAPIDYYEINELLDIYDFAQDEEDAMVQMFVFLTVARHYPESKEFDERMGFFLSYVSQEAAGRMLERGGRRESALWDVLRLGVQCYPLGDPVPYLEEILKKYDFLDCESTLKLVDLLRDMDHRDLLVVYYPQLKVRAEDPRGLAFEIADTVKDVEGLQEDARKIADELTKLEPFNADAWLLLARIEFGMEHAEEALAAVDYALALEPDQYNAKLTRGIIMVVMPEHREEAIQVLTELLAEQPLNAFALEGLAEACARSGRKSEACDYYMQMVQNDIVPMTTADPMLAVIELDPENLEEYLQMYADKGYIDENDWKAKAEALVLKEKFALAAKLLDFYHRKFGLKQSFDLYLHTLYDAQRFERFAEVFEAAMTDSDNPASEPGYLSMTDYLLLAAVYLRLGRKTEAAELSAAIAQTKEISSSIEEHLRTRGIRVTARFINTLAKSEELTVDLRDLDPLNVDFLP